MRIANRMYRWESVKALIFGVTYEHEVWNETDEERVVLLMAVRDLE